MEIWVDEHGMKVLNGKQLVDECSEEEWSKINKCILHCYWNNDSLMFKRLIVLRPKKRPQIIKDMHNEIGHFGEARTLIEIQRIYF